MSSNRGRGRSVWTGIPWGGNTTGRARMGRAATGRAIGGATTRVAPTGWVLGVGRARTRGNHEGCPYGLGGGGGAGGTRGRARTGGNHKGCPYGLGGGGGAGRSRYSYIAAPRGRATTRVGWWGTWGGRPHPSPPPEGEGILWFVPGWVLGVGRGWCHQTGGGGVPSGRGTMGWARTVRAATGGNHKGCPYGLGGGGGVGLLSSNRGWGHAPSGRGHHGAGKDGVGGHGGQPQGLPLRVGWWGIWGGDAPTLALPRRGRGFCGLLRVGGWGWGGA